MSARRRDAGALAATVIKNPVGPNFGLSYIICCRRACKLSCNINLKSILSFAMFSRRRDARALAAAASNNPGPWASWSKIWIKLYHLLHARL